jgi:lambda repressor-like predicted transcriptional regulator
VANKNLPVDVIVNDYKSGINTPALALRYGVDRDTISRVLARAGVARRGRVIRYKELPLDDIIRDYRAGDTLMTLANRHGVCDKTIGRMLRRAGVPLRDNGRQARHNSTHEIDRLREAIGWQPTWVWVDD